MRYWNLAFAHMNLNGPIALGNPTEIRSIMFARDPELGELHTPNGSMQFLQVVGLTEDEEDVITDWNAEGLLEILREGNPLLVTDLERKSILKDEKKAASIREKSLKEGSSQGTIYINALKLKKPSLLHQSTEIEIGAIIVDKLVRLLRGRILYERELGLLGDEYAIIMPEAHPS